MPTASGAHQQRSGSSTPPSPLAAHWRWRRVFPGQQRELSALRQWLSSLLAECPAHDDVLIVANELASNALQHTASGRGASFAVEIVRYPSVVQIAIADRGGPAEPQVIEDPSGEHGRGLLLVRGLSVRTGFVGDQRGRLVWAEVSWGDAATPTSASPQGGYEAAIGEEEAALARRFAGVPAWFGRSTLAWWAVAGAYGLVCAPTAQELAGLLHRLLDTPRSAQALDTGQARGPGTSTRPGSQLRQRPTGRGPARREHPGTVNSDAGKSRRAARTQRRISIAVPGLFVAGAA